jgi:phosphoribosylaminoimidazolecarboxamide formyltransferase/IMP cyclohydrolase
MPKIERAILSCYDKTGIVELAQLLIELGVEIISTSGTLKELQSAGVQAVNIADFTGVPEMMDGRVKSLHAKVHAGLLGLRDNKLHCEQMQAYDMQWIDLVVANLQPFEKLTAQPGITPEEVVEQTDIGGAAMLRSAAKNFRYVTVAVNPERYPVIMHELRAHEGEVSYATRYRLAQEAFCCTADYDRAIAEYLRVNQPPQA